ncbi:hypothetical protein PAEAM_06470 [Paenibacillus sp. GM1FR]|uniref:hypothetical protein n=1 Tax=Paenibacillus sp. GM1FR TaxID=2059267 RepID=UPI000CA99A29|nr:hypothetical protein [Paenibacillus sp. GM1FR]PJN64561.1 hypothetical protein PAEAM_06470 [Paenibacillus sp. GM1FR]
MIEVISEKYYKFLMLLPFEDGIYMLGMKEAKAKYIANLNIDLAKRYLEKGNRDRRNTSDLIHYLNLTK